jgi:hypothetical protein
MAPLAVVLIAKPSSRGAVPKCTLPEVEGLDEKQLVMDFDSSAQPGVMSSAANHPGCLS